MNDSLNIQIKDLHACYERESQMPIVLGFRCTYAWQNWIAEGFTLEDLELTIRFIHKVNKTREPQFKAPLSFLKIIQDTDRFADYCSQAKADSRKPPPPTPKQQVSEQAGFYDPPDSAPAKPIRDVMKESAALADLRQWKLKTFGTEL